MSEELNIAASEVVEAAEPVTESETTESIADSAVVFPEVDAAGAGIAVAQPAHNADWLTSTQIIRTPWFKNLSRTSQELLLVYWKTGDRLATVEEVLEVSGEAARLATYLFDKGSLKEAVDLMTGVSERDQVLRAISKAVRSRKTTKAQVAALRLQAELVLGIPADDEE